MTIRVGTSGFSYAEWKGHFYPDDLPAAKRLSYYASKLGTVEINNTFYRLPSRKVVSDWAAAVPDDFSFVLKASRRITHQKKLEDVGENVATLDERARLLGDKLGALLFQLPPFLRKGRDRLATFLEVLPAETRCAIEFRHQSWMDDEIFELLREHDVALCLTDSEEAEPELLGTASWGYLRLRREGYSKSELDRWAKRIASQPWSDAFVFLKHETEGPQLALDLAAACPR